jgi:hypothetical protein
VPIASATTHKVNARTATVLIISVTFRGIANPIQFGRKKKDLREPLITITENVTANRGR